MSPRDEPRCARCGLRPLVECALADDGAVCPGCVTPLDRDPYAADDDDEREP